jgi:hypothetical protein
MKFVNTSGKTYVFHIPKKRNDIGVIPDEDLPVYEVPVEEGALKDSVGQN